jgi:uncharacterized membrane protein
MNQRQIGIILIIISILLSILVISNKMNQETFIQDYFKEEGTCFTDDGTCLHNQQSNNFILGIIITLSLIILGLYLIFFDKTQKVLLKQHKEVSSAIKQSKEEEKFKAFLAGFSKKEKKVLEIIKEQEGIKQSTLRYKTETSKTALSLMLKDFEEKGYIHRKEDKKTKRIYLKKVF